LAEASQLKDSTDDKNKELVTIPFIIRGTLRDYQVR
jgi:hypothetical protein